MTEPPVDNLHDLITEALHGMWVEAPIGSLNARDTEAIADELCDLIIDLAGQGRLMAAIAAIGRTHGRRNG